MADATRLFPVVSSKPAYGDRWQFNFVTGWAADDWWQVIGTSSIGDFVWGSGNMGRYSAYAALTYRNRVYLALGALVAYSTNGNATGWEDQGTSTGEVGAGVLNFNANTITDDLCIGLGQMLGKVAMFGRNHIQLWNIDADPNNFSLSQLLNNIGTIASLSIEGLGDFDVLFLARSGVRSLRSLNLTENAYIDDIGIPVDSLVQADIQADTTNSGATAFAIVDPMSRRYWLYLNGAIYVLSLYRTSKIAAWSKYDTKTEDFDLEPTKADTPNVKRRYSGLTIGQTYYYSKGSGDTALRTSAGVTILTVSDYFVATDTIVDIINGTTPTNIGTVAGRNSTMTAKTFTAFTILNTHVYALGSDGTIYQYGGPSGFELDACKAEAYTDFQDNGKRLVKMATSVDVSARGTWTVEASTDYKTATTPYKLVGTPTKPTYDWVSYSFTSEGTHVKFHFYCNTKSTWANGYPVGVPPALQALIMHYNEAGERR